MTDRPSPPAEPVLPWRIRGPRAVGSFVSPAVRRVAADLGIDPATVRGTGTDGRVTRDDIVRSHATPTPATERIAFNRVQQRAGAALLASKKTSAHAYSVTAGDYTAIDEVRHALRARWRADEGFSLTYLPFVARAVVDALRAYPILNATTDGELVLEHREVNFGIAVDLAHQGLVVPVVRGADTLRLRGLARAIDGIARRARAKQLMPDDLAGGTFTITNPGAARTYLSFPIINQPQVAILSTDGVARRVVVDEGRDGRAHLDVRSVGHLCLAFDARVVDAQTAGAFLDHVATVVAERDWSTEF